MSAYDQTHCTLELRGELTIGTAAGTQQKLRDACAAAQTILVDLSAAEETDLTLVQLLLAARQTALAENKMLRLIQPLPQAFACDLERGGFLDTPGRFWTDSGANTP